MVPISRQKSLKEKRNYLKNVKGTSSSREKPSRLVSDTYIASRTKEVSWTCLSSDTGSNNSKK